MASPLPPSASRVGSAPRAPLGPILAGLLLDMTDLATFGPLGLRFGLLIGAVSGWLLAPSLGVSPQRRWLCALGSGVYCMLPFTSFLPLGTVLGALVRLQGKSRPPAGADAAEPSATSPIDAEYRSRWDDPAEGPAQKDRS